MLNKISKILKAGIIKVPALFFYKISYMDKTALFLNLNWKNLHDQSKF